ncbi:UDP-glucose 6-dehydrogenase YwqF [Arthrobacter sp. Bi26]|uniref:UDP-glucose dehydrogenase family protein n=1 Tax=Arthrobacter sp. Bi26 TaxID=2822350 RepID=UPI001DB497CF|nr:UDP-glucose/GDP-mannose dehydrogenase family protein [Arthrobacter sp. Bi26]CAH0211743.1 UDP-glucose 6-dehydrogenase YwqF [Arthrobacter sp. Bi26]
MRITVIGTGYLGAVHAAGMASFGHDVMGVDVDAAKIDQLSRGLTPFFEPGLQDLLRENIAAGRLKFSTSLEEAAGFGDVHFICVGTPQSPNSTAADMRFVDAVVQGLAPHLKKPCLLVGKSTVPVGTAARLSEMAARLAPSGTQVNVAWNPEFLREGFAVEDTLHPDRLVIGVTSADDESILRDVYAPVLAAGTPFISTDLATAELVKVSANAFLATKISFINAIADICEAAGADIMPLAAALGHDSRIGSRFLAPGVGFGGGCLPKDIRAFMARAEELGVGESLDFLKSVDRINVSRPASAVDLARDMLGGSLMNRRVAVLGAAFKPNSDDVRDSQALKVAKALQAQGAHVRVHDPEAVDNARAVYPTLNYTHEADKAFEGAELTVHLTEWSQYRQLDPTRLLGLVTSPRILDARNTLDIDHWRSAGWTVRAMGRPSR